MQNNNMKMEFRSKNYSNTNNIERKQQIWLPLVVGLMIGYINGFCGGGGGMICVPALSYILKLEDKMAHATTIFIMLPLSIASLIVYLLNGSMEWNLALPVSIGFAVGGFIGALILNKINNVVLQVIFAFVIILGGVKMII